LFNRYPPVAEHSLTITRSRSDSTGGERFRSGCSTQMRKPIRTIIANVEPTIALKLVDFARLGCFVLPARLLGGSRCTGVAQRRRFMSRGVEASARTGGISKLSLPRNVIGRQLVVLHLEKNQVAEAGPPVGITGDRVRQREIGVAWRHRRDRRRRGFGRPW